MSVLLPLTQSSDYAGIAEIISAIALLITTVNSIINGRRVKQVKKDIKLPDASQPKPPDNPRRNGNTLGEEVHDLREDVFAVGRLLGSHLVFHSDKNNEFPVTLGDLREARDRFLTNPEDHDPLR